MEQTRLVPDRLVEWKCIDGHDNWRDNTFSFELEARGEDTQLIFRQHYARELPDDVYGTYNFNWGYYLNSLKQLCETRKGMPFEPPAWARVTGNDPDRAAWSIVCDDDVDAETGRRSVRRSAAHH